MRFARRALATTVATLGLVAGSAGVAGPAAAGPEDGEGCVGLPSNHALYVCVISVTPENALPTTSSTPMDVPVPAVCYFLDCTEPTTVSVPVPWAQEGSGQIVVIWHNDVYYPIAVGVDEAFDLHATISSEVYSGYRYVTRVDQIEEVFETAGVDDCFVWNVALSTATDRYCV